MHDPFSLEGSAASARSQRRRPPPPPKSKGIAFALWFFFGWAGAHEFYLGNHLYGIILLGTLFGGVAFGICLWPIAVVLWLFTLGLWLYRPFEILFTRKETWATRYPGKLPNLQ